MTTTTATRKIYFAARNGKVLSTIDRPRAEVQMFVNRNNRYDAETGRPYHVLAYEIPEGTPERPEPTSNLLLDTMNEPVAEMRLPELVREFVARKCDDARGVNQTQAQHNRLGVVVDELRRRGALD